MATNSGRLSFLLLISGSLLLRAGVIEYTDRALWTAAAGSVTNIGFEGIAPPGGTASFSVAAGLTLSGVQFVSPALFGSGYNLLVVSSTGVPYVNDWGSGDKLQGGVELDLTLPAGVTAVGSDIMTTFTDFVPGSHSTYTARLSTGDVFTNIFSSGPPTRSFVGFTSTTPISSIQLLSSGTFAMVDNVAFAAVPEPSSFLLVGIGFGSLAASLARLRKRSRQADYAN